MSALHAEQLTVTCPGCGAHFHVAKELAGHPGRCSKCGRVFQIASGVPASHAAAEPARTNHGKPAAPPPQYVGFECHVCQTRMYGTLDQVGQSAKCPDCGAMTKIPPPAAVKAKSLPPAMMGEQYELWDADTAPLPSELLAAQPTYIPIDCRMCQTLFYAGVDQVGQQLACPDCGTRHVVPSPTAPAAKHRLVLASEIYELDEAAAPGERPAVIIPPRRPMLYEEEAEQVRAQAAHDARRGKRRARRYDARGRPIMPRWPLVTGVWRMLVTQEVIARWVLLSIVFGFSGQLLAESLLTPLQGQAEAIKLIFAVLGMVLAGAWLAMAGPLFVAIVGESAEGNDSLLQPPRLLAFDWLSDLFSVVLAGTAAGLCGLGALQLAELAALRPAVSAAIAAAVVVAVLPVALLSTLLEATPLGVVSPRLLRSFRYGAGPWLLFYVQTYVLAAFVGAAAWFLAPMLGSTGGQSTAIIWGLAPLAIAALLLEMRLLGRLAWWISELTPEEKEQGSD